MYKRQVQDRAENAAAFRGDHRGVYHAVTARAVAPLATLVELTVPFLVEGGLLLALKGQKAAEEIEAAEKALRELRGVVVGTSRHDTGTIVVVEKRGATPRIYPRRDGEPKRRPL